MATIREMRLMAIQEFFFKAMLGGWAAGGEKVELPDVVGYKAIPFVDGKFSLLDRWCVGEDLKRSAGTTTIWHANVPVWVMHYGGCYEEQAIPFVKSALEREYRGHRFQGGRGPRWYQEGALSYSNHIRPRSDFAEFSGREEVFYRDPQQAPGTLFLGYHDYWGMSLI